eukprot:scaffold103640_cov28-Tisochrysis_lutea.AAC.1
MHAPERAVAEQTVVERAESGECEFCPRCRWRGLAKSALVRSGEFFRLFDRSGSGVERLGLSRPPAAPGSSLVDQRRVRRCQTEERREGGLE